jgi:hypothetical protein
LLQTGPWLDGRSRLNNNPVMVVGVLPASFDGSRVDVFIPWPLTAETNRYGNTLKAIGIVEQHWWCWESHLNVLLNDQAREETY